MARTPRDVTETELAILEQLWQNARTGRTIRQITDALYPGGTTAQYATVQKLLDRLVAKRLAQRDRSATAHVFTAAIARDDLIGRRLQDVAEQLCGGSLTPLLTHLVKARKLTPAERRELRDLIEEDDRKKRT